jgi:hypothetical protein
MVARNFEAPADTNTDNVYEVTIVATDVDNNRDSESQRVTVTDVTVADVPEIATFTINPIADARVAETGTSKSLATIEIIPVELSIAKSATSAPPKV